MFYFCALLCVHSSFAIISIEKRKLIAFRCLSSLCLVIDAKGLSTVCDCGIFYSTSIFILVQMWI